MASIAPNTLEAIPTLSAPRVLGKRPGHALAALNPEWLIGMGRFVTSLFAAVAIYLDPTQPAHFLRVSETVLGLYVVYALLIVLFPVRQPLDSRVHLISHGIDVVVLGGLSLITNELTSPFFAFLPFLLLATTMRWGMAGAILGAMTLECVLLVVARPDLKDGESELNLLIMRSAYFLVAACMLGYFGASRDRSKQRLARLADWPFDVILGDRAPWLNGLLRHAADVLGEPRMVVVWQDQELPVGSLAYWDAGRLQLFDIGDASFWSAQNFEAQPQGAGNERNAAQIEQVDALLQKVSGLQGQGLRVVRHAHSATFSGLRYRGRFFVLDPACHYDESASLTEIIAVRIGSDLERFALMTHIAETARSQERVRFARDLHDSILQDLTAAGLKLKAATARVPDDARPELRSVSALMLDQQRRIRLFVEDMCQPDRQGRTLLSTTLTDCARALRERWVCDVRLCIDPAGLEVPAWMSAELAQMISEATANAVRHGGASEVHFAATGMPDRLEVRIVDNGSGIADGADGLAQPGSLSARVSDLGGTLSILRYAPGLSMLVDLPL